MEETQQVQETQESKEEIALKKRIKHREASTVHSLQVVLLQCN